MVGGGDFSGCWNDSCKSFEYQNDVVLDEWCGDDKNA
jgi:hypothetical protein